MSQDNVISLSDARLRRLASKHHCGLILIDEAQKILVRVVNVRSREDMIARLCGVSGGVAGILPGSLRMGEAEPGVGSS